MNMDTEKESLYHVLPEEMLACQQRRSLNSATKSQLLTAFLQRHVETRKVEAGLEETLRYQQIAVPLSNRICRHKHNRRQQKGRVLTTRQLRQSKLLKIDKKHVMYELYQPLAELWKDYISDVINFDKVRDRDRQDVAKRLMNADLHGACLHVTQSRCSSLVGISGIVLQETKNAFVLVTSCNKLKTVPKQNSVFSLDVHGHLFTIYGSNFRQRASERCVSSFKSQKSVDL